MNLSVIMPTLGRDTLARAVRSVLDELVQGDQLIVVGDGPQPRAEEAVKGLAKVRYLEGPLTRCWGHEQRNFGMRAAQSTHLAWLDDDDVWLPGARHSIGAGMESFPDHLLFFKMKHMHGMLWKEAQVRITNVSTQMYVFPNRPGMLGRWKANPDNADGSAGDYLFATETVNLCGGEVRFLEPVIAQLFGQSKGKA